VSRSPRKHFLDTSVARPMLLGSRPYKEYFDSYFGSDSLYISTYVKMEFRRSFLLNLINFFFVLDMPTTRAIDDAFALWSERFKTSELKAVIQLASPLFATQHLDPSNPRDKPTALLALGRLIKRFDFEMAGFLDTGVNSPRCARAGISLDINLGNLRTDLRRFVEEFTDVETCRSKCRIDTFLLKRHRGRVQDYARLGNALPNNSESKGFKRIAENLADVLQGGPEACSCKRCERIGDAVIALDTPRNLNLEHTDASFNQLCDAIGQPHQQHPSHIRVVRRASEGTPKS